MNESGHSHPATAPDEWHAGCPACDAEIDTIAERVIELPLGKQVDVVLGMLEVVTVERNRLRATLDAERTQWAKETRHAARRIGEGARERDRLRAVVDAARAYVEAEVDDQCGDAEYVRDGLVAALAALDASTEAHR